MPNDRGVLVVDFGAQYAQLIARRVREAHVFSEIVPSSISAAEIKAKNPSAIILSGGPSSVYADNAPKFDAEIFTSGIPIFGICYGFQLMAAALGGVVSQTGKSEFGRTESRAVAGTKIFAALPMQQKVWMSHGDAVTTAPIGFTVCASTPDTAIAAFENETGLLAGVQFHPEVLHSEHGQEILQNWLVNIAKCDATWTTTNIAHTEVAKARALIGNKRVICGLSGGVDSAVAAAIIQKAVGDQLTCVFVDHGLLRSGEAEQVERDFVASTGVNLVVVDAQQIFLSALKGVTDPEEKRKIIGREFIRSFEKAAREIASGGEVEFLVQGTLYPGLGIRIIGEVTQERLDILRSADAIVRFELKAAALDRDIWQCPVVLLAKVRSVGVQGDGRTYGHPIVLRPVSSEDAMTADWSRLPYEILEKISTRITNEVHEVNRVVLDITSKPPGTIEWE